MNTHAEVGQGKAGGAAAVTFGSWFAVLCQQLASLLEDVTLEYIRSMKCLRIEDTLALSFVKACMRAIEG